MKTAWKVLVAVFWTVIALSLLISGYFYEEGFLGWWLWGVEQILVGSIIGALTLFSIGFCLYGMFQASTMFLVDTREHINRERFGWHFLKPFGISIAAPLIGYAIGVATVLLANEFYEGVGVIVEEIFQTIRGLVIEIYLWPYLISIVSAGMLFFDKYLGDFNFSQKIGVSLRQQKK